MFLSYYISLQIFIGESRNHCPHIFYSIGTCLPYSNTSCSHLWKPGDVSMAMKHSRKSTAQIFMPRKSICLSFFRVWRVASIDIWIRCSNLWSSTIPVSLPGSQHPEVGQCFPNKIASHPLGRWDTCQSVFESSYHLVLGWCTVFSMWLGKRITPHRKTPDLFLT